MDKSLQVERCLIGPPEGFRHNGQQEGQEAIVVSKNNGQRYRDWDRDCSYLLSYLKQRLPGLGYLLGT